MGRREGRKPMTSLFSLRPPRRSAVAEQIGFVTHCSGEDTQRGGFGACQQEGVRQELQDLGCIRCFGGGFEEGLL